MSSDQGHTLPMDQIHPLIPSDSPSDMSEFRRKRRADHSQSYITTLTVFSIAATCLVSSAAAFTSSRTNGAVDTSIVRASHESRSMPIRPFGFGIKDSIPSTRLFAASDPNSDKAEWRALLAAFQMYKAAYGDLKVPTRFVVPSMAPWPGKFRFKIYLVCAYIILSPHSLLFSFAFFFQRLHGE